VTAATPVGARPVAAAVRPDFTGNPLVRAPDKKPRCGKLAAPLTASMPLLGDRLRIKVPKATKASPRPWNLMDAPEAEAGETRVMVGGARSGGLGDEEAMAILASETWQLDPDLYKAEPGAPVQPGTFAEEAPKFLNAVFGDSEIEAVAVADPRIHAYAARPRKVELGDDSARVLSLLLSLPDGTLQTLSFHISPALLDQAAGCTALAEQIAASLVIGPRSLTRAAGVREFARLGDRRLTIALPEDYVVVHQAAEDFDRYHLYKLRPLSLYPGDLTIAVDSYPDRTLPPDADASVPGQLLGAPITWQGQRTARGGTLVVTQPLTGAGRRFLQVSLRATREPKYLDEFRKIAETLQLQAK
jgi:hypothetical protein